MLWNHSKVHFWKKQACKKEENSCKCLNKIRKIHIREGLDKLELLVKCDSEVFINFEQLFFIIK